MTRPHVIEHTVIDVTFESEEEAFAHQAVLTSSVKNRLLPVVDDVFTELSPPNQILRIDRLEIDLGTVLTDGFADEMARRLKERLADALREHLQQIGSSYAADLISRPVADLECVEHFLRTGSLPWQATPGPDWTIDDLLQRVIASHGPEFLTFLRGAIGRGNVLTRLAGQFSETVLIDLVRLLEPGAAGFITEVVSRLTLGGSGPGESPDGASRRRGWEFSLTYLLVEQGSRFDPRAYLASVIRQEAAYTRRAVPDLLQALMREGGAAPDAPGLSQALHTLLNELAAAWGPHPPAPAEGGARSAALLRAYDRAETLRTWLLTGVAPQGGEPLSVLLDSLVRDSPWLLLQLARDLQTGDVEGAPGTAHLPSDVWRSFFTTLLARLAVVNVHAWQPVLDRFADQGKAHPRLYGTLLEQLLRGQELNEQRLHDEPAAERLDDAQTDSRRASRENAHPSAATDLPPVGPRQAEAECLAALQSPGSLSREELSRMIATLDHVSAAAADQLRRPIAALLVDRETAARLTSRLPERLLTRLLYLVRPAEHAEVQRVADFLSLAAIGAEPTEGPAGLRQATWQLLFRYLIEEGQPFALDTFAQRFASVLAEERPQADAVELRRALSRHLAHWPLPATRALADELGQALLGSTVVPPAGAPQGEAEPRTERDRAHPLADASQQQAGAEAWWDLVTSLVQAGEGAELAAHWPRLCREEPVRLREIVRQAGQRAEVRRRLADTSSEAMLRDLVGLLEPEAQAFIAKVVGCPELVQPLPGLPPEPPSRHRLWEFTLTYLLVERGSSFSKSAYLGSVIRQMAAPAQRSASAVLQAWAQQLARGPIAPGRSHELRQLLNDLRTEWDRRPALPADAAPRSQALLRSYDRSDELRAYLFEGVGADRIDLLATLLDNLLHEAPWLLLQLARDLQAGDFVASSRTTQDSRVAWRSFFELLLARLASINGDEWLRAFDQHTGQVMERSRFYGGMLEGLLCGQDLNVEALLLQSSAAQGREDQAKPRRPAPEIAPEPQATGSPPPVSRQREEEWLAALQASGPLSIEDQTRMIATLDQLRMSASDRLRRPIESLFADRETAARLIERLPERLLTRLLYLLCPGEHAQVQRVGDLLSLGGAGAGWSVDQARLRRATWQLIFRILMEEKQAFVLDTFVHRFVAMLAELISAPAIAPVRTRLRQHLIRHVVPTTPVDHRTLAVLSRTTDEEPRPPRPKRFEDKAGEGDEPDFTEQIYITNAGQVLASAYLPRLFAMLNLTEQNAFRDSTSAMRAVHLLQFMVNESVDSPEYQLVLNKILSGVKPGVPIERRIVITTDERQAIEGMLRSMIQHWKVVGNTSIAGFRESFLQREGRLRLQGDAWHLLVEPRAFDMLLDQIPWSFSTIKYPWMDRVLYVEWR